jgi:hypothetical protein
LIDVNEAFASQFCAVEKDLQLDPAKTNVNGGAVALGHRKEESTVLSFIDLIVFVLSVDSCGRVRRQNYH